MCFFRFTIGKMREFNAKTSQTHPYTHYQKADAGWEDSILGQSVPDQHFIHGYRIGPGFDTGRFTKPDRV
jgi:hypothetical protein